MLSQMRARRTNQFNPIPRAQSLSPEEEHRHQSNDAQNDPPDNKIIPPASSFSLGAPQQILQPHHHRKLSQVSPYHGNLYSIITLNISLNN